MRKFVYIIALVFAIAFSMSACNSSTTGGDTTSFDWEAVIRADLLSGESKLEKMVAEKIEIQVISLQDSLEVEIIAPDICDELLSWMKAIEDANFTEQAMENEIIRLLDEVDSTTASFNLPYAKEGTNVEIEYSQEFGDMLSCGLSRFNREITQYIMGDMVN